MADDQKKIQNTPDEGFSKEKHLNTETNMNTMRMRCLRCGSLILEPSTGAYIKNEVTFDIPSMKKKQELVSNNDSNVIHTESCSEFWLLKDMLTFENIGFTNTVDKKKYLICADCEIGPLGLQNLDKPNEFLVCVERVKYC